MGVFLFGGTFVASRQTKVFELIRRKFHVLGHKGSFQFSPLVAVQAEAHIHSIKKNEIKSHSSARWENVIAVTGPSAAMHDHQQSSANKLIVLKDQQPFLITDHALHLSKPERRNVQTTHQPKAFPWLVPMLPTFEQSTQNTAHNAFSSGAS